MTLYEEGDRLVEESWDEEQMGVRVERCVRKHPNGDMKRIRVFRKENVRFATLDGDGEAVSERHRELTNLSPKAATEVLFGLAEAFGYRLEEKR
ncbi:hypothetical protein [Haloferax sulfurifontis]|uniref:Uncharacterized protein n=2 Tax=Haloferax sulfurifontis TaxID=255616 RepID=M0IL86_9EURY|nr:hypothetical protein [Haloferax sulfurifontis]ELZ96618.1 hypothetical protein C441_04599 [Haloferax sulfurifontis ATCC BAA-897]GGC72438.1 hypothetical protein GCM10007209_37950 [Haloferax sulfurifontis]